MDSGFCVAKGIIEIKAKGVCAEALTNTRIYWLKGVHGDLIDTHFEDKEVSDVGMIEARTKDNKLFKIFLMKYPDYVKGIIAIWVALDELEGEKTRRYFIDSSGTK